MNCLSVSKFCILEIAQTHHANAYEPANIYMRAHAHKHTRTLRPRSDLH